MTRWTLAFLLLLSFPTTAEIRPDPPSDPPWSRVPDSEMPNGMKSYGYRSALHGGKVISFAMAVDDACDAASPCIVRAYAHGSHGDPIGCAWSGGGLLREISNRNELVPAVWVCANGLASLPEDMAEDGLDPLPEDAGINSWADRPSEACEVRPDLVERGLCLRPALSFHAELVPLLQQLDFVDADTAKWWLTGHSAGGEVMHRTWLSPELHQRHYGALVSLAGGFYFDVVGAVEESRAAGWEFDPMLAVWGTSDCGIWCPEDDPDNHYFVRNLPDFERLERLGVAHTRVLLPHYDHEQIAMFEAIGLEMLKFLPYEGVDARWKLLGPIPPKGVPIVVPGNASVVEELHEHECSSWPACWWSDAPCC